MSLIAPPFIGGGSNNINVAGFPSALQPFPNITPFSYPDGLTFQKLFESYRMWLLNELVPHVNDQADSLIAAYNAASAALAEAMTNYTAEILADRNAFNQQVTQSLALITAQATKADTARVAAEAARDLAEQWAAQTHALQDAAVTALVNEVGSTTRATIDGRYPIRGEYVRSVREFGAVGDGVTDDTAAIQAALNTGDSVILSGTISGPNAKYLTTDTLVMKGQGQHVYGPDAVLYPAHSKDVVVVSQPLQWLDVTIDGSAQTPGNYADIAAIRIGGTAAAFNPMSARVAGSSIINYRGNGIIWDHGAMIDFTSVYMTDIGVDGIRATEAFDDNNHGHFADVHIIRAAGRGYAILGKSTTVIEKRSRSHMFMNTKAFQCGRNYYFESVSCTGSIFSELSVAPVTFTADSGGNDIAFISTETDYEACVDNGSGNHISGYSRFGYWDNRLQYNRRTQINNQFEGVYQTTQTAKNDFEVSVINTNDTAYVRHVHKGQGGAAYVIEDYSKAQMIMPGGVSRLANTKRAVVTVPNGTTIAAGATYLVDPQIANIGPGWSGYASIVWGGGLTLLATVNIHPAGYSRVCIYNPTGATVDISNAVVECLISAYL